MDPTSLKNKPRAHIPSPPVFYGWFIAGAGFVCLWLNVGIGFYSFPVFVVELAEHFGWGRGMTSAGVSITFIGAGLASPVVGRLLPGLGPKRIILAGALIMSISLITLGFHRNLWQFYVLCGLLAVGMSCTGTMPTSHAISDWFEKRRGAAMGIMMVGVGLGGLVFVPLTRLLIDLFTWQMTFVLYGILVSALLVPIAAAVFRQRPAETPPDGRVTTEAFDAASPGQDFAALQPPWTLRRVMRTPVFYVIGIAFILATFGQTPLLIHQVAYFQDIGISPERAARALGLCAFLGIGGKLFFGAMTDRCPARFAMALCFGLQAFGVALLLKTPALGSPFWFVVVWGFAMGGVIALEPLIVAECFGLQSFGVILGMIYVMTTIGGSVGIPFAGFVFDAGRSYVPAFQIFAVAYALAAALSLLAVPPRQD